MNQLPTDYQVDSNGVIVFPFLGRVSLAGLTPVEASEKIAARLNKPRKVTVIIKESNTYWVSILGNVARPGKYQIKGQATLLSALSEAGGPLSDSDLGGAILISDNIKTKVNLNQYFHDEGRTQSSFLYPGDVLMVKKSDWPSLGEWAIVASILASLTVVTVDLSNLRK
jgi:polysaccharide export outer membrane protein